MNGFFLIDKPKGITSQGVVNKIKKQFNLKKCGHTGTLDPNTTGLLVVGCDEATKLIKLINEHDKKYITTVVFGYDSNTLDISGEIISNIDMQFSYDELCLAINKIKAIEEQIPPMVSAIKVNGRKLYEYERKGISLELIPRNVKIYELNLLSDLRLINGHLEIDIEIYCSKGFYVRSFARDLGKLLGGCAIMKELRRIESGDFKIDKAIPLEDVSSKDIHSIEEIFADFDKIEVNDYIKKLVLNGIVLDERQIKTEKCFYVYNSGKLIAIYEVYDKFKYKPIVIFKE